MLASIGSDDHFLKEILSINLLQETKPGDTLTIVVESRGRSCYGSEGYLNKETKGLKNNVTLDGVLLQDWLQCGSKNGFNSDDINTRKCKIENL